jgi:hypothetical protein
MSTGAPPRAATVHATGPWALKSTVMLIIDVIDVSTLAEVLF